MKKSMGTTFLKKLLAALLSLLICMVEPLSASAACSHRSTTWKITSSDVITGIVYQTEYCDSCNAAIDTRMRVMPTHENGTYTLTPVQFCERFGKMFSTLNKYYDMPLFEVTLDTMESGELICPVFSTSGYVAALQFKSGDTYMRGASKEDASITCVTAFILDKGGANLADICIATALCCSTNIEVAEASNIVKKTLVAATNDSVYTYDGITFAFHTLSDGYSFSALVQD